MNAPTEAQCRTILNHVLTVVERKFIGAEPDTAALRERHEQKVVSAQTKADFEDAMNRMLRDLGASAEQLLNCTVRVTRCDVDQVSIGELARKYAWRVIFARRKRGGAMALVDGSTRPAVGARASRY